MADKDCANQARLIATEEAFATPEYIEAFSKLAPTISSAGVRYAAQFVTDQEMGRMFSDPALRLADMDANGIDMHLLSLVSPGVQIFDADLGTSLAAKTNDRLAELVRQHPDRFAGLAAVAPQDPVQAAREVERAMKSLGLNGIIINSHTHGEFLDDPKFSPLLEAAQSYRAPIYLHPSFPPDSMIKPFEDYGLHGAIWGFAAEAGLHAVRMVVGGVFDRFPDLQIVLGHMGEGLPYFLFRLDNVYGFLRRQHVPGMPRLKRNPSDYVRSNIHITTSGMFWDDLLGFGAKTLGAERILFAIDYPFESYRIARDFIANASISSVDRAKIMSQNAERLFNIPSRPPTMRA
jgi:5-carboxyvanillate decarboxylase